SILAGITKPDGGRIDRSNGEVGWVPQQAGLYRRLTVEENLRLFARMEGADDVEGIIERMLDQTGLEDRRHDQVSSLSGGNQQRINIAIGLLGDPSVLLLDEPSSGLDPSQRVRLWEFVAGLAKAGTTVIYSTHQIEEASHYGDRLVVLADGETIFDGTFAQMRRQAGPRPKGSAADPENDFVRFLKGKGH
ncbi:MAG TPA: ABC transporter ATP-binding protein, partial [Solirubrobacterales bacterium]|nr:ABC transporter ATP-binding protein [Solirubrobacterales bacterium]